MPDGGGGGSKPPTQLMGREWYSGVPPTSMGGEESAEALPPVIGKRDSEVPPKLEMQFSQSSYIADFEHLKSEETGNSLMSSIRHAKVKGRGSAAPPKPIMGKAMEMGSAAPSEPTMENFALIRCSPARLESIMGKAIVMGSAAPPAPILRKAKVMGSVAPPVPILRNAMGISSLIAAEHGPVSFGARASASETMGIIQSNEDGEPEPIYVLCSSSSEYYSETSTMDRDSWQNVQLPSKVRSGELLSFTSNGIEFKYNFIKFYIHCEGFQISIPNDFKWSTMKFKK